MKTISWVLRDSDPESESGGNGQVAVEPESESKEPEKAPQWRPQDEYLDEEPDFSHLTDDKKPDDTKLDDAKPDDIEPNSLPAPERVHDEFTSEHYAWGNEIGLGATQVDSFESPQAFMSWIEKNQSQPAPQQYSPPQQPEFQQQQPAPLPQQPAPMQHQQQFAEIKPLNSEDVDDNVVAFSREMIGAHQHLQEQVGQVLQQNQQLHQQLADIQQSNADELVNQQLDQMFDQSDEKLFGRGRLSELSGASARNRMVVVDSMRREKILIEQKGRIAPPLSVLKARVEKDLFGNIQNQALQRAAEKSQLRSAQTTVRPSHSDSDSQLTGTEAAERAVGQKMSEMGIGGW